MEKEAKDGKSNEKEIMKAYVWSKGGAKSRSTRRTTITTIEHDERGEKRESR